MAKILIVDDEPNIRRVLSANLRQAGYEVVEAAGVAEACDKVPWQNRYVERVIGRSGASA